MRCCFCQYLHGWASSPNLSILPSFMHRCMAIVIRYPKPPYHLIMVTVHLSGIVSLDNQSTCALQLILSYLSAPVAGQNVGYWGWRSLTLLQNVAMGGSMMLKGVAGAMGPGEICRTLK
jgi:hypothetical protein